jgi:hypothetical protein
VEIVILKTCSRHAWEVGAGRESIGCVQAPLFERASSQQLIRDINLAMRIGQ